MYPYICQIYGDFYLNCYGLAILIGITVFYILLKNDPKTIKLVPKEKLSTLVFWGTLVGIIGGRLLWLIFSWQELDHVYEAFEIWKGGLSVLGSILAIITFFSYYLKKNGIPVLQMFDLASIYAPLMHSISRVGCFMAGCCYGLPSNVKWALEYSHPDVLVEKKLMHIPLHPTQLYSSTLLFLIFLSMYFVFQNIFKKPGQLTCIYLMLASLERFTVDFYRADREYFNIKLISYFSIQQYLSLAIFLSALLFFIYLNLKNRIREI